MNEAHANQLQAAIHGGQSYEVIFDDESGVFIALSDIYRTTKRQILPSIQAADHHDKDGTSSSYNQLHERMHDKCRDALRQQATAPEC